MNPMPLRPRPSRLSRLTLLICGFYVVMALTGLLLVLWRRDAWGSDPLAWPGLQPVGHLLLAALLVAVVHLGSRLWLRRSARARRCAGTIRRQFHGMGRRDLLALALFSGIGEELLFRGWLLHETNLWWSSLLFGLVHLPPGRDWIHWPLFAAVIGLLLGLLTLGSGTVLWAILAHAGINYFNLRLAMDRS